MAEQVLGPKIEELANAVRYDEFRRVRDLLTASPMLANFAHDMYAVNDISSSREYPLVLAASLGNRRTVQELMVHKANAEVHDAAAVRAAVNGLFVPCIELLLGRGPGKLRTESDVLLMGSLTHKTARDMWKLDSAVASHERFINSVPVLEKAMREQQIWYRRVEDSNLEAAFRSQTGPTGICHPQYAQELWALSENLPEGAEIGCFVMHTWVDDPAERFARVKSSMEGPSSDAFKEGGGFFIDALCVPQWDAHLLALGLLSIRKALHMSEKCLAVISPDFFCRPFPLLELLSFAKLNGYGAVRLAAMPALQHHAEASVRNMLGEWCVQREQEFGLSYDFHCKSHYHDA